ncbi:diaminopimelate epimerase [Sphingomonas sp. HT-1]|uniref:diaminopimelate epimerase n=1 Tax=unclassified Sphingomonas TaxID=196159 RepID=UPI0002F9C2D0|nr:MULTISPECIES: diaminopimelate epimerase [unclassified Sphingomonas]KTF69833.1 diaminopimelate epimerase [Sphingomonas sp. WG]
MRIAFIKCHGSGNDFPLIDARALALSDADWATLARLLADRAGPVGGDGLLALVPGDDGHRFGMRMWNSDGSEAETCLNGLRCTARLGFEVLGIDTAQVKLKTSTATAARDADIAAGVTTIRTLVGPNSTRAADVGLIGAAEQVIDAPIHGLPNPRRFTAVAMPNPHLVTFVDQVDEAELVALGRWCESRPALIPARANVSFVEQRGPTSLFVRTFERGVGLTDSCGSAMAASVLSAALTGRVPFATPVAVFNRGGMVRGQAEQDRCVMLSGNATFEAELAIDVDLAGGTLGAVETLRVRDAERSAWAALVAGTR